MSLDLDTILDALADRIAAKVVEKRAAESNPNELLRISKIAKELRTDPEKVRDLIRAGTLQRAEDFAEMRVSRRELERYTAGRKK